ncbi:MAG: histidine phosphatase family protein [Bacteroidetes bacterium]|nr:histidine phosphatase family protein [Bacteroidota bacterium]MDA0984533.1 histidine phosphatase family protein [Bacteroidota bacterium]
MKELLFLRHAKSSWENEVEDRNRPLTENGVKRIQAIANASKAVFQPFEIVFSSPANRALHTACIMMYETQRSFNELQVREALYTFNVSDILRFVKSLPENYSKVICVGHNPAFTSIVTYLTGSEFYHLPTAAWAKITFEQNSWESIANGTLSLGMPKDILNT